MVVDRSEEDAGSLCSIAENRMHEVLAGLVAALDAADIEQWVLDERRLYACCPGVIEGDRGALFFNRGRLCLVIVESGGELRVRPMDGPVVGSLRVSDLDEAVELIRRYVALPTALSSVRELRTFAAESGFRGEVSE